MRKIVNPKQRLLFDPFEVPLTDKTRKRLLDGWEGVFRNVILELMPVDVIGSCFDAKIGRPTKELYSMAGLLLIKEFKNLTVDAAVSAYCFNINVHYALNLEPIAHDLCERTLERYMRLFEQNDIAKIIMDRVTSKLVDTLEIKVDKQRLDSTHIFSDMASFGRTRLMGVAVKRFLTQLKRHNRCDYDMLEESIRKRYEPGENLLFSCYGRDDTSRRLLRQDVADDMYYLIRRFSSNEQVNNRDTYKAVERIFYQQCDVQEDKVVVKEKTGGNCIQNPSDPDATYDGHKGPGYQVQLAETCNPENQQQFITCAIAQTASEPDSQAVEMVLEDLKANDLTPNEMLADTLYCGDDNCLLAQREGVELVGPVPGSYKDGQYENLNIDDFNINETTEEVICCPAGHKPRSSKHNNKTGVTKTMMPLSACGRCEFFDQCPIQKSSKGYKLRHTAKDRRIAARKRETQTDVFKERYRARGAIEGTNSGVKRKTGLDELRVRGIKAVSHQVYMKITGWNILRATACAKMREIIYKKAQIAYFSLFFMIFELLRQLNGSLQAINQAIWAEFQDFRKFPLPAGIS